MTHDKKNSSDIYGNRPAVMITPRMPPRSPVSLSQVQALFDGADSSSHKYVVRLQGTITNISDKPVTKLAFCVVRPRIDYFYYAETGDLHVTSRQSIAAELGTIRGTDEIQPPLNLKLIGIRFADGTTWGKFEPGLLDSVELPVGGILAGVSADRRRKTMPPIGGIKGRYRFRLNQKRTNPH